MLVVSGRHTQNVSNHVMFHNRTVVVFDSALTPLIPTKQRAVKTNTSPNCPHTSFQTQYKTPTITVNIKVPLA